MAKTKLVAIVNVTPDSFSDGGQYADATSALNAIAQCIDEGAEIIDIGAESTRPGATPVTPQEEWHRLEPVLAALPLFASSQVAFSVDTRHAATARWALDAGVHWINDVSGFADLAMVEAVREADCKLVVMHSLSVPADKHKVLPQSADVVPLLLQWGRERISALENAGIARERIIFDPGIGFGKAAAQSWAILRHVAPLAALDVPLLIGHSRKSFLTALGERDEATLIISQYLAQRGIDYLRVHDVARHRRMLSIVEHLHG